MTDEGLEKEVPKGRMVPPERRAAIYHAYCMGESVVDLSQFEGVTTATIQKIIREQRRQESMPKNMVVAGDKRNGRLLSTTDPHRYEGTCVIRGRAHSKTFTTVNARKATEMWERWCQELRDEEAFLDMVERKEPEEAPQAACGAPADPIEEIVPVEPAPTPVIEVRPWREVAEERQARIEELEARVAELEADASAPSTLKDGPAYVLWAKTDTPRMYGVYQHMSDALGDMDRLNDVAAFLGSEDAFEVEEVVWRG